MTASTPGERVTYDGRPARSTNTVMKILVIIAIIWVAFWAVNGGLEQITVPESSANTSTTVAE